MNTEEQLKKLERDIYGNGQPGLRDRVTIIETQLRTGTRLLWGILVLSVPNLMSVIDKFTP